MLRRILPLGLKILLHPRGLIDINVTSQQYLNHNLLKFPFSTHKPEAIRLQAYEWKAVIAYYVYQRIIELSTIQITSFGSIRQEIADQQKISNYILEKIKVRTGLQYSTIEQFGIEKDIINQVICAFQFNKGIQVSYQVWLHQKRFFQAQINDLMILNPQCHSGRILQNLIDSPNARIISGQKGIGKSFSYLLYSHLSSFIIECRIRRYKYLNRSNENLYKFVDQSQINKFPHLIYFPLKQTVSQSKIIQSFKSQIPPFCQRLSKLPKDEENQQWILQYVAKQLQNMRSFLQNIKEIPTKGKFNGIKLLFVVDEANNYYREVRALIQEIRDQRLRNKQQRSGSLIGFKSKQIGKKYINSDLRRYSNFLLKVQRYCIVVLNQSQEGEQNLVEQWNSQYTPSLFDIFQQQQSPTHNVHIEYTKSTFSKIRYLQLYNVMWFEIQKILRVNLPIQKHLSIQSIRQHFIDAFKLITKPTSQKQEQPIKWLTDVSPLNVRKGLQGADLKQIIKLDPYSREINYNQRQKIKSFFINLKEKIQENRFQQKRLVSFKDYLCKGATIQIQSIRYQILVNLHLQVTRACLNEQNKQDRFIFSYASLIDKYAEKHWALQEIQNFTIQLGEGANYEVNKTIVFMMKPILMRQMLKFLSIISIRYKDYFKNISQGGFSPQFAGFLLDNIYNILFRKENFHFCFTTYRLFYNIQKKTMSLVAKKEDYLIKESLPIEPIVSFDQNFEIGLQLRDLIKKANQYPNESILGYIAAKITNQPNSTVSNSQQQYLFQSKNGFFDFAIVTYHSKQKTLIIQLIDNTLGHLQQKIQRSNTKKQKIWQKINKADKVNYNKFVVQLIGLGPTLNGQKYFAKEKRDNQLIKQIETKEKSSCEIIVACFDEKDPKNHFRLPNEDIVEERLFQICFQSLIKGLHDYNKKDQLINTQQKVKQEIIKNQGNLSINLVNEQNNVTKADETK